MRNRPLEVHTADKDVATAEALTLSVEAYEAKRWPVETTLDRIYMIKQP